MDSVQWKGGSAAVKVHLTAGYPTHYEMGQTPEYGPQNQNSHLNGAGTHPIPRVGHLQAVPTGDLIRSGTEHPAATTWNHRVLMKNVEVASSVMERLPWCRVTQSRSIS
jgi:hypothetical protein